MFNLKHMFIRLFASLALTLAAAGANASPIYHVALDTSAYAGTGWLDLQFNPGMDALPATASVSRFTGVLATGLPTDLAGGVNGSLPGPVVFNNAAGFNALFQAVVLGGFFGFDLQLSDAAAGSVFALALYGADQTTALGQVDPFTNNLVSFERAVNVNDAAMVSVTMVPEPATLLLLLSGLLAVVWVRARR